MIRANQREEEKKFLFKTKQKQKQKFNRVSGLPNNILSYAEIL